MAVAVVIFSAIVEEYTVILEVQLIQDDSHITGNSGRCRPGSKLSRPFPLPVAASQEGMAVWQTLCDASGA